MEIAEGERKAKMEEKGLILELPPLPRKYDKSALHAGYQYEKGCGKYPFNPRRLVPESLLDIDIEWLVDYGRFKRGLKWAEDLPSRPANMN